MKIPTAIALLVLAFFAQAQTSWDSLEDVLKQHPEADANGDGMLTVEEAKTFKMGRSADAPERKVVWQRHEPVPGTEVAASPGVTVQKNVPTTGNDTVTLTLPLIPGSKTFIRLRVTP